VLGQSRIPATMDRARRRRAQRASGSLPEARRNRLSPSRAPGHGRHGLTDGPRLQREGTRSAPLLRGPPLTSHTYPLPAPSPDVNLRRTRLASPGTRAQREPAGRPAFSCLAVSFWVEPRSGKRLPKRRVAGGRNHRRQRVESSRRRHGFS